MAVARSRLPDWRWLVWAILPGHALHELTHYAVGQAVGAEASIESAVSVRLEWRDASTGAVLLTHVAPLLIGYTAALASVGLLAVGVWPTLPNEAWLYIGVNWLYYSFPTRHDLGPLTQLRG